MKKIGIKPSVIDETFYLVHSIGLLVLWLVEAVSEAALATIVPIEVAGHEHTSTTLFSWTLTTQTVDLAIFINLKIHHGSHKYSNTHK